MNLSDLRSTLHDHADFADGGLLDRAGAVQHRVRVVRRRRRAALAGTAAAVVLVGAGVVALLPGGDRSDQADRDFAGMTAPATMESLGYTYSFDRMIEGEGAARFDDDIEGPLLLTWADAGEGDLILGNPADSESRVVSRGDFTDFVTVEQGDDRPVFLSGTGKLALAVYTLTDRPAGITKGGVTFREERADARLIAGAIGDEGQTELTVTFPYPEGLLQVHELCVGAPKGYYASVEIEDGHTGGDCDAAVSHDGSGSYGTYSDGLKRRDGTDFRPGDMVTARMWVSASREERDTPVEGTVQGLRLGAAFYEEEPAVAEGGSGTLTEMIEFGGHRFRFVELVESPVGDARSGWAVERPVGERPVVFRASAVGGTGEIRIDAGDEEGTTFEAASEGFGTTVGPFATGTAKVSFHGRGIGPDARLLVAVYERID